MNKILTRISSKLASVPFCLIAMNAPSLLSFLPSLKGLTHWAAILLMFGSLIGCSSGSDEIAGIEGTGDIATASGTVTGFGSVYVNGIHFETEGAKIEIDGQIATETDLDIGMVVTVEGTLNETGTEGIAQVIYANTLIRGGIQSIEQVDFQRKTLKVLGQTVFISEDSVFKDTTFEEISQGQRIAISGLNASGGAVAATYIAVVTEEEGRSEIEGFITATDFDAQQFSVNDFTVDFSQAEILGGNEFGIQPGALVEVLGTANAQADTLTANIVTIKPLYRPGSETVIFEGVVDEMAGDLMITLNGTAIDFEYVSELPDNLVKGSRIVVRGEYRDDVLLANELTVKPPAQDRFRGEVSDINLEAGQFTVLDTTFDVDVFTAFEDRSRRGDRFFYFDNLQIEDSVEVFTRSENGRLIATRIRRENSDRNEHTQSLRGDVFEVVNADAFIVMGVFVDTSELPEPNKSQLANLMAGTKVHVEGHFVGYLSFKATEVVILEELGCREDVFFDCFLFEDDRMREDDRFGPKDFPKPSKPKALYDIQ